MDLAPLGLASQTPDDFLVDVYRGHEQVLQLVLHKQLARYRQHPLTLSDLVGILKRVVPNTMALLSTE